MSVGLDFLRDFRREWRADYEGIVICTPSIITVSRATFTNPPMDNEVETDITTDRTSLFLMVDDLFVSGVFQPPDHGWEVFRVKTKDMFRVVDGPDNRVWEYRDSGKEHLEIFLVLDEDHDRS